MHNTYYTSVPVQILEFVSLSQSLSVFPRSKNKVCDKDDCEGGRVTNIISISLGAAPLRHHRRATTAAADGHVFALSSFV